MYASSSSTSRSRGTAAMNASNSSAVTTVPVGLFGVQTMTTRVRSVIAAAIASRSWPWSGRLGTCTLVAPATVTRPGYASNERHEYTTSSPGPAAASDELREERHRAGADVHLVGGDAEPLGEALAEGERRGVGVAVDLVRVAATGLDDAGQRVVAGSRCSRA